MVGSVSGVNRGGFTPRERGLSVSVGDTDQEEAATGPGGAQRNAGPPQSW